MKKLLTLASIASIGALLAGCAGTERGATGTTAYSGSGYGASRTELDGSPGANQQGAGAADLTGNQASTTAVESGKGGTGTTTPQTEGGTGAGTAHGTRTTTTTTTTAGTAAGTAQTTTLSEADKRFTQTAIQHGIAEIGMGQLILQRSQNPELRSFGQHLIDDHNQANQQLAQIAARKDITIPTRPDASQQTMMNQLVNLSGTQFDTTAVNDAVRDHQRDIALYQQAANTLQDPDLKAYAQKTLPILQQHLDQATQLQGTLSGAQGGVGQ